MKRSWQVILGFILVFLVVLFAVVNVKSVPVNLGIVQLNAPLILVILASAFVGAIVVFLTSSASLLQKNRQIKKLKQTATNNQAEQEKQIATVKEEQQREFERQVAELKADYETQLKVANQPMAPVTEEQLPKSGNIDYFG